MIVMISINKINQLSFTELVQVHI